MLHPGDLTHGAHLPGFWRVRIEPIPCRSYSSLKSNLTAADRDREENLNGSRGFGALLSPRARLRLRRNTLARRIDRRDYIAIRGARSQLDVEIRARRADGYCGNRRI